MIIKWELYHLAIVYTGLKQLKLISLRQGALEVSGPIPRFRTSDIMVWSSVCVHVCVSTCVRLCLHIHISQHSNMSCADQPSLGMSIMMIHYGTCYLSTKTHRNQVWPRVPSQAEGCNRMSSQNIYLPCYTVEAAPASCLTALNEKAMFWFISRYYARWCQRRRWG